MYTYSQFTPAAAKAQHRKRLLTFTGKRTRRKKGSEIAKSNTTNVLQKRYEKADPVIIVSSLKPGWIPHASIMEEMFLINITPWSAHQSISDYADFLIQHIYHTSETSHEKCTYFSTTLTVSS